MRVLLVDDDDRIAFAMTAALTAEGYGVETVHAGAEALGAIRNFQPDVVVLDITLHDVSGIALRKMIRAEYRDLPIIFASGHALDELEEFEQSGRTAFLQKPFPIAELVATIKRLASRRRDAPDSDRPGNRH